MIYVLDASAMVAFLRKEFGGDVVSRWLADPGATCCAHAINLCEVYYDFYRGDSPAKAERAVQRLKQLGVIERADFDETFWKEVGKLKATYRASLADFCAVALTNRLDGVLLTSDHHELDLLAAAGVCTIEFIR